MRARDGGGDCGGGGGHVAAAAAALHTDCESSATFGLPLGAFGWHRELPVLHRKACRMAHAQLQSGTAAGVICRAAQVAHRVKLFAGGVQPCHCLQALPRCELRDQRWREPHHRDLPHCPTG